MLLHSHPAATRVRRGHIRKCWKYSSPEGLIFCWHGGKEKCKTNCDDARRVTSVAWDTHRFAVFNKTADSCVENRFRSGSTVILNVHTLTKDQGRRAKARTHWNTHGRTHEHTPRRSAKSSGRPEKLLRRVYCSLIYLSPGIFMRRTGEATFSAERTAPKKTWRRDLCSLSERSASPQDEVGACGATAWERGSGACLEGGERADALSHVVPRGPRRRGRGWSDVSSGTVPSRPPALQASSRRGLIGERNGRLQSWRV